MTSGPKRWLTDAVVTSTVILIAAWLASGATSMGDWDSDSYPAVHALATGHLGAYLNATPMMGPFATLVQAPLVALSRSSGSTAYQWAVFSCLLGTGLVGAYLGRIASRRGAATITSVLIALLCLLNPLTFEALRAGHPEELLTGALLVAALAAAAEARTRRSAVLLGLAIATKQWAVIGILPVLLVLPKQRLRVAAAAAAVVGLLMLPGMAAAPGSFLGVQKQAAGTGRVVTPWSAWYPLASSRTAVYRVDGRRLEDEIEDAPAPAGGFSHPLIVLSALVLPLALARRRGLPLTPGDGFALLALLALLRCVLDPVDNLYYQEPLLLALIGWDAFSSRGLPLRGLLATAVALVLWQEWHNLADPLTFNVAYLTIATLLGTFLASSLFGRIRWTRVQRPDFSPGVTQISGIK